MKMKMFQTLERGLKTRVDVIEETEDDIREKARDADENELFSGEKEMVVDVKKGRTESCQRRTGDSRR